MQCSIHNLEIEYAAKCMVFTALEQLSVKLASYLAAGVHLPQENGRQAVVLFLEELADTPLDAQLDNEGDRDAARALALEQIEAIVDRVRAAAELGTSD